MKKIFVVSLLLFLCTLCFARGKRDSLELGLGYATFIETSQVSGYEVKTEMPSFAINLSGISFFTDKIGLGAYGNIMFPQKITMSAAGSSSTIDRSAYDFLMSLDMLVGPVFVLYQNEKFALPLAAGFHYFHAWFVSSAGSVDGTKLGIGTNLTGEYHFTPNIYLLGRLQVTLDFYDTTETEIYGYGTASTSTFGSTTTWGIDPTIGIGFSF